MARRCEIQNNNIGNTYIGCNSFVKFKAMLQHCLFVVLFLALSLDKYFLQ